MKLSKILAMILALSIILSVGAYAAETDDADADETEAAMETENGAEPEEPEAPEEDLEEVPESEDAPAGYIVLDRHNGNVRLEGATVRGDTLLRDVCGEDGTEGGTLTVLFVDTDAAGDILHEDEHTAMRLELTSSQFTGAVNPLKETEGPAEAEAPIEAGEPSEAEDSRDPDVDDLPASGTHMTMDGASAWTVTADSRLDSFTAGQGSIIEAAEGRSLAIYVNCDRDAAGALDAATGTYIAAFVPDVAYFGVVIRVTEEEAEADTDLFAALGIDTAIVDGEYGVSLEGFLEAMGVSVSYDEETGNIIIEDPNGLLGALADEIEE